MTANALGTGVTSSSLASVGVAHQDQSQLIGLINTGNSITTTSNLGGGALNITGNTILGDAAGDTVTFNSAALSMINASTIDLVNNSATALNIEAGLLNIDTSNSRIGLGTTAPNERLDINGRVYLADSSAPGVTTNRLYSLSGALYWNGTNLSGTSIASGTITGQTLYWNGSAWTSSVNLYNNNTNVGIGTTAPGSKLDVNGGINIGSTAAYKIGTTNVLTASTLGTGVTNSSLASVGTLISGSINTGFGSINTGNSITTTSNLGGGALDISPVTPSLVMPQVIRLHLTQPHSSIQCFYH